MSGTNKGRNQKKNLRDDTDKQLTDKHNKDKFYDSGRTDSGFLSGSNLVSDSLSGEISPPPERTSGLETECYKRLDSGVEISEQLSSLEIDERFNDLSCSKSSGYGQIPVVKVENADRRWQHYFQQDEDGDSSLHIAVMRNRFKDVLSLVQMIPDAKYLDIRNDMRQTALHLAVLTSQKKMVELLVAAGAKTDSVDHHGNTPLHLATAAGDLDLVKELTLAPSQHTLQSIKLRYKPQTPSTTTPRPELNMYNYQGLACVHLALLNMAILKHLTWYGGNINAPELKGGLTAVHMASSMGNMALVNTLVKELGAEPCPLTYGGESPFSLARQSNVKLHMLDSLSELGCYSLGDSEDEDEDHLHAHYYSDSDDDDVQMVDRCVNLQELQVGLTA